MLMGLVQLWKDVLCAFGWHGPPVVVAGWSRCENCWSNLEG